MTTLREAVIDLLQADVTLMAILTGGVWERREINRTLTPSIYTATGAMKPCAVVLVEATSPVGPAQFDFEQVFFLVWLYEESGNHYSAIDLARDRVRALLHRQSVAITAGCVHEIRHADGGADFYDDVLSCEAAYERFYAWRHRA